MPWEMAKSDGVIKSPAWHQWETGRKATRQGKIKDQSSLKSLAARVRFIDCFPHFPIPTGLFVLGANYGNHFVATYKLHRSYKYVKDYFEEN